MGNAYKQVLITSDRGRAFLRPGEDLRRIGERFHGGSVIISARPLMDLFADSGYPKSLTFPRAKNRTNNEGRTRILSGHSRDTTLVSTRRPSCKCNATGGGEEFSKGCKLQTLKVWVDFSRLAYCNVVPYFRLISVLCEDRCVRSPPNNLIAD